MSAPVPGQRPGATAALPRGAGGGHLPALDGVRGAAILMVIAYHIMLFGSRRELHGVADAIHDVAMLGWTGVDLFFVLSGFLITGILHDSRDGAHRFRNFYLRRALRIFPLYYAALLVGLVLLPQLLHGAPTLQRGADVQGWFWTYTSNVLVALRGWKAAPTFIDHFWSLAVEEQFYLVWPFLVFFVSRRRLLAVCALTVAIALALRVGLHARGLDVAAYVLTPARIDGLALGGLLALVVRDPRGLAWLRRWSPACLALCVALLLLVYKARDGLYSSDPVVGTVGYTVLALLFGSLLAVVVTAGPAAPPTRLFSSAVLRFFGRYSYALYVFHQPVLILLALAGYTRISDGLPQELLLPALLGYGAAALALSVALSLLSWHLLEKHFLRLKDRFADARSPRAEFPAPAPVRPAEGVGPRPVPIR